LKFSILTDYPIYFILFCLLAGALVAFLSYQKNTIANRSEDQTKNKTWWDAFTWPVWLLAILRFLSVSILCFLLLSPVVKSLFKKVEKPVVIIAADNSQSILLNKDSNYYRTKLPAAVQKLAEDLGSKYDVRTFTFGGDSKSNLNIDYKEKQTNISGLYDKLYSTFYNQNIGAVITLSDGLYNQGQNPLYSAQKINAPFYTVALGDTQPQKDVLIRNVMYNQVVYSGNFFPLQVQVRAKGYPGRDIKLSVSNKGKELFSQPVKISNNNFYIEIPVKIEANTAGLQHYHIELTHLDGEISYVNNSYDLFIDVLDSKKKILLVADAPHPDVSAIKSAIERNSFYEVSAYSYDDFVKEVGNNPAKLKNYQLAILHQLPGTGNSASQLISALKEALVPVWYIIGSQSAVNVFNSLDAGLKINVQSSRLSEMGGAVNPQFSLFTYSPEVSRAMQNWPPLLAPFGEYNMSDRQNIAVFQQIGKVKTPMPLMFFTSGAKQKVGVLCGEGIWKWFMFDYAANQNHKASDEFIDKTIQYLSAKTDNRLFRVRPAKNMFFEDEKITFDAEVYNKSFDPIKDALVKMTFRNENGKVFDYNFQPRGNAYFLDAGYLPSGSYTYTAQTKIGSNPYSLNGEFIVKKVDLEFLETVANHQLLFNIAQQQGGKMIYPKDLATLTDLLQKRDDIKPLAYMETDFKDLVDFKILFFLLLGLISAEWFLRKYWGAY
jgi:hypothetical protein